VLLLLCAAAACSVQLYSSTRYGDAMVQRLSAGLAQQIASSEPLLDSQGKVNRQTLKSLFDRLMTLNPSVELYMISRKATCWPMPRRRGIFVASISMLPRCSTFYPARPGGLRRRSAQCRQTKSL
jgi:hypothetical protein